MVVVVVIVDMMLVTVVGLFLAEVRTALVENRIFHSRLIAELVLVIYSWEPAEREKSRILGLKHPSNLPLCLDSPRHGFMTRIIVGVLELGERKRFVG